MLRVILRINYKIMIMVDIYLLVYIYFCTLLAVKKNETIYTKMCFECYDFWISRFEIHTDPLNCFLYKCSDRSVKSISVVVI